MVPSRPSRPNRRSKSVRAVAAAILLMAGCNGASHGTNTFGGAPAVNVLLISVDTLRADHLGVYGYSRLTSPNLDLLSRSSITFSQVFAPTPWTLPSHAGLLTGIHPFHLGLYHRDAMLPETTHTLAQALATAGYRTAAFVDSGRAGFVGAARGFDRGFDEYSSAPFRQGLDRRYDIRETVRAASIWLAQDRGGAPFFLFLHTKSVHAAPVDQPCSDSRCNPYTQPAPFDGMFLTPALASFDWADPATGSGQAYLWGLNRQILAGDLEPSAFPARRIAALEAQYDAGIAFTDKYLGVLFDTLRDLGLSESTAIVVTSDHGEAFLDHNLLMHQEVYDEALHIPLILKLPGSHGGTRVQTLSSILDIAPTILELARVPIPPDMEGRVLPLTDHYSNRHRSLFAYYLLPPSYDYRAFSLFDESTKVVLHDFHTRGHLETECYQRRPESGGWKTVGCDGNDPKRVHGELIHRLGTQVEPAPALVDLDSRTLQMLETIGYVD